MSVKLLSEVQVGPLTLHNRIHIPPMCQFTAHDGLPQQEHYNHYLQLARSGASLLTLEATAVSPDGRISPWDLGIWDDTHAEALQNLVSSIKEANPELKLLIQLGHAGRKGSADPQTDKSILLPDGFVTVAPSDMKFSDKLLPPRALSTQEVPVYVDYFRQAARRAVQAGFDGIMLHAAHGYLIHQFLSPLSNTRTDIYGGNAQNRRRFCVEIYTAIKEVINTQVACGIRISATDWLEGGLTVQDNIDLLQELQPLGLDFIDVSTGGLLPAHIDVGPGYQLPFAAAVKKAFPDIPVCGVGLITSAFQAETALRLEACDIIDVGRGMLKDPQWGVHAAAELQRFA